MNFKKLVSLCAITLSTFGLCSLTKANAMEAQPPIIKAVFIGDTNVGKSSIYEKITKGTFSEKICTVGIDFNNLELEDNGKKARIRFWDTAGLEKYNAISTSYLHDADLILVTFSYDNEYSIEKVDKWLSIAKDECENFKNSKYPRIIIIGNKCDLFNSETDKYFPVSENELRAKFSDYNFKFFSVSALTGYGVDELKHQLTDLGFKLVAEKEKLAEEQAKPIILTKAKTKNGCC